MMLLTIDEILMLHDKLIASTGGSPGLRDRGLLESAVYSVESSFEDVERYPSIEEKAARLAFALVSNHAFLDGNKRIGVLAMLTTLRLNSVALQYSQQELIQLGLSAATGEYGYEAILKWITKHHV